MAREQALKIDQGSRFQYVILVTNLSLTGLSAKMQIKSNKTNGELLLDASQYVSVNSGASQVIVDIPGSATEGADWLQAVYDIKVYNASNSAVSPVRIIQGNIVLDREVTV